MHVLTATIAFFAVVFVQFYVLFQLRRLREEFTRQGKRVDSEGFAELLEKTSRVEWPRQLQFSLDLSQDVLPPTKRKWR